MPRPPRRPDDALARLRAWVERARRAQAAVDALGAGRPAGCSCPGSGRPSAQPTALADGYGGAWHDGTAPPASGRP